MKSNSIRTKDAETSDANAAAFMAVTEETKDGSLYKYLTISAFPEGWADTKFVCKVFKTSDKSELYKSEAISLTSSSMLLLTFELFNGYLTSELFNVYLTSELFNVYLTSKLINVYLTSELFNVYLTSELFNVYLTSELINVYLTFELINVNLTSQLINVYLTSELIISMNNI